MAIARSEVLRGAPTRLSWGAIFGGTFVALGLWILLLVLGLALGLTSVDPNAPAFSVRSAGIGGGIWLVVSGLIALFVGGLVASRTAGPVDRLSGTLHGLVLWGFTTVAAVWFLSMAIGSLLSGLAGVGKTAAQAVAGGGQGISQAAGALGLDYEDLLAPVNQRLRQAGKPTVSPDQLQAAVGDLLNDALRGGKLDRNAVIASITDNTALSRTDAEQIAGRIETAFNQQLAQLQTGAAQVAETSGKIFWGIFFAFLLDLAAAVLGALVGVGRKREVTGTPVTPAPTTTTPGETGVGIRKEAYP